MIHNITIFLALAVEYLVKSIVNRSACVKLPVERRHSHNMLESFDRANRLEQEYLKNSGRIGEIYVLFNLLAEAIACLLLEE